MVLVAVAVLVVVPAARVSRGRPGRGLVVGALAGAAAVLVRVEAGAAVAAQVLLVPVGKGLAAKGQLVVLDGDDLHPCGLGRGVVVVVGVLVGRRGRRRVGAAA